jgi:hypothetical protein
VFRTGRVRDSTQICEMRNASCAEGFKLPVSALVVIGRDLQAQDDFSEFHKVTVTSLVSDQHNLIATGDFHYDGVVQGAAHCVRGPLNHPVTECAAPCLTTYCPV